MAKTLIWTVVLIVSALILASGGINAQRDVVPIDEPDPPAAPAPMPEESSTVPVMVENFPTTQTVDIRGFPHVVTVEGTVDVANFPATQEVAGMVDVGNLPLDADGNLKVNSSAGSNPPFRFFRLPDLYGSADGTVEWSATFDVSGWGSIDFVVKWKDRSGSTHFMKTQVAFIDPEAGPIFAADGGNTLRGEGPFLLSQEVRGPEMRVGISSSVGFSATAQIWVYLSN